MPIKKIKITDLVQDDRNLNRGNARGKELIETSVGRFGAGRSVLIDKNNRIIAGNKTQEAAIAKGIKDVIVVETDGTQLVAVKRNDVDLDSKDGREMALADNATVKVDLEWDTEELNAVAEDFGIDVEAWDVDLDGMTEDATEAEEDDFDVEQDEVKTVAKRGDIFVLGNHRLMCGDSTNEEDVAKLMNGERADLVFTDPPYGMKKESEGVLNDNLNFDDLLEFNKRWIPLTFANLKDNGSWYCWGIDEPLMDIYSNILRPMQKRNEITFRNLITWDKGDAGAGGVSFMGKDGLRSYPISDEKCLFVMCGKEKGNSDDCKGFENGLSSWYDGFEPFRSYFEEETKKAGLSRQEIVSLTATTASHYISKSQYAFPTKTHYQSVQNYCREKGIDAFTWDYDEMREAYMKERNGEGYAKILSAQAEKRAEWYATRAYFDNTHDNMTTVWHFNRTKGEERAECGDHATPKPLALCARGIKTSSREGEIVLDVFGGSGSTLIACEQLGRKCYMMELDPHYCDVIIARWEKLTGQQARKIEQ